MKAVEARRQLRMEREKKIRVKKFTSLSSSSFTTHTPIIAPSSPLPSHPSPPALPTKESKLTYLPSIDEKLQRLESLRDARKSRQAAKARREAARCAVCLQPAAAASSSSTRDLRRARPEEQRLLDCGHACHVDCIRLLRSSGCVASLCAFCHADVPPSPQKTFDEAMRLLLAERMRRQKSDPKIAASTSGSGSSSSSRKDATNVVVRLLLSAAMQEHTGAAFQLGLFSHQGAFGVPQSDADAVRWWQRAARQKGCGVKYKFRKKNRSKTAKTF